MLAPVVDANVTCFVLRPHVVATVIDDGAVLLDLESKFFYRLNSSAWSVTQLFETAGMSRAEIETACRAWGATDGDIKAIDAMIDTMQQDNLLETTSDRNEETGTFSGTWTTPTIERQAEPLHRLITSAFDPSIPLAE